MIRKFYNKIKVVALHYKVMGFINATSYVFQRLFKRKALLLARIKNSKLKIYLRNDRYDTQIFTQIFMRNELNIHFGVEPQIIIDGGANIGLATLYFKNKFPNSKIIAVEPEQSNFDILLKNTKVYPDVYCLQNGIWNRKCRLKIIDNGDGNASFITRELTEKEIGKNEINAITINNIIDQFKIEHLDLLKLDIEGSEKNVFEENYDAWLNKTQHIIVEIHSHLNADAEEIIKTALKSNFLMENIGEYCLFSRKVTIA